MIALEQPLVAAGDLDPEPARGAHEEQREDGEDQAERVPFSPPAVDRKSVV